MSSFRKSAVALLLALSIGAQWPLLQSFAWLNMLVSISVEEGIQQALVKTFDGKHLCKICKFVRDGKEAEKKTSPAQDSSQKKLDPMLTTAPEVWLQRLPFEFASAAAPICQTRSDAPLTPPPDLA